MIVTVHSSTEWLPCVSWMLGAVLNSQHAELKSHSHVLDVDI